MADPVAAASHLSGCPAWVLLESFGTFGDSENATTASSLTSSGSKVKLSFELVDPPGVSRWFVDCPGPKKERFNGRPFILNAAGSLIVLRMAFLREERSVFDYFVFRAGPGEPKLDLIPGPYPKASLRKRVGVLPLGAGEHYLMVFPTPQLKPQGGYEIQIFSSDNGAWSTKVARVSTDPETTFHEMAMHHPSKAIAAGGNSLAWVDLWRGILLCEQLDSEEPVLRLIKWPVPSPCQDIVDMYSAHGSRDATLSNGVIRFLEMKFHHADDACHSTDGMGIGWTATVWKRMSSSKDWKVCFKADIAKILATHLNSSDLLQKVRDDTLKKLDLTKVATAPPTLSLTDEDVVYFMANLVSDEALLLAVNGRVKKLEAVEQTTFELPCSPCPFYSLPDASPGSDMASQPEDIKRESVEPSALHVMSILLAREQLLQFAERVAYNRPSYQECISFLSTSSVAYLAIHLQELAQYATSDNVGQAASEAVTTYHRAIGYVCDLVAQDENMIGRISDAVGALDNLLLAIPEKDLKNGRMLALESRTHDYVYENGTVEDLVQYATSTTLSKAALEDVVACIGAAGDIDGLATQSDLSAHEAVMGKLSVALQGLGNFGQPVPKGMGDDGWALATPYITDESVCGSGTVGAVASHLGSDVELPRARVSIV